MHRTIALAAVVLVGAGFHTKAEKAPLPPAALEEQADAIVTAEVVDLSIATRPSHFEHGIGNKDWVITLYLRIKESEKGSLKTGAVIQARAWRIKSRRSMTAFLSPGGHRPVPGNGSVVRVFLNQTSSGFDVVLPNGIVSPAPGGTLTDAPEVAALRSGYSFLLPLEGWTFIVVLAVAASVIVRLGRIWRNRRAPVPDTATGVGRTAPR